jgi:hypothetical protein
MKKSSYSEEQIIATPPQRFSQSNSSSQAQV